MRTYVNQTYGDHFTVCTNVKPLCCISKPNKMFCVNQTSVKKTKKFKSQGRTSPVVQWLRTRLPVQETGSGPGWGCYRCLGAARPGSAAVTEPTTEPASATREGAAGRSPCAATKREPLPTVRESLSGSLRRPGLPKQIHSGGFPKTQRQILIQTNCIKMQPHIIHFSAVNDFYKLK